MQNKGSAVVLKTENRIQGPDGPKIATVNNARIHMLKERVKPSLLFQDHFQNHSVPFGLVVLYFYQQLALLVLNPEAYFKFAQVAFGL